MAKFEAIFLSLPRETEENYDRIVNREFEIWAAHVPNTGRQLDRLEKDDFNPYAEFQCQLFRRPKRISGVRKPNITKNINDIF